MKFHIVCSRCGNPQSIEVTLEIRQKEIDNRKAWKIFIHALDLSTRYSNALLRWGLGEYRKEFLNKWDRDNLVHWFIKEIEKPKGGRTREIANFGIKGIKIVKERLDMED